MAGNVRKCVVARYTHPYGDRKLVEVLPPVFKPSEHDITWVKNQYSWRDHPKGGAIVDDESHE